VLSADWTDSGDMHDYILVELKVCSQLIGKMLLPINWVIFFL
jgi:hypothetical protein